MEVGKRDVRFLKESVLDGPDEPLPPTEETVRLGRNRFSVKGLIMMKSYRSRRGMATSSPLAIFGLFLHADDNGVSGALDLAVGYDQDEGVLPLDGRNETGRRGVVSIQGYEGPAGL